MESLIATFFFWCTFMFSIGPWWIAFMDAITRIPTHELMRNYFIYILVGWSPFLAMSAIMIRLLGGIHTNVLVALHFGGGAFILYLAYKTLSAKIANKPGRFFDWREMSITTWLSPKAWITIPTGSLVANFTASTAINVALFVIISIPIFMGTAVLWAWLGKQGDRITGGRLSYVNATLFIAFALYLFYQGWLISSS